MAAKKISRDDYTQALARGRQALAEPHAVSARYIASARVLELAAIQRCRSLSRRPSSIRCSIVGPADAPMAALILSVKMVQSGPRCSGQSANHSSRGKYHCASSSSLRTIGSALDDRLALTQAEPEPEPQAAGDGRTAPASGEQAQQPQSVRQINAIHARSPCFCFIPCCYIARVSLHAVPLRRDAMI